MCGIAGIYAPGRQLDRSSVAPMLAAMAHRGPDDRGTEIVAGGQLALGHLRLSILDLSPLGHQPMQLPGHALWVVYNGEIYNFREVRGDLARLGWAFRSGSDTEVILCAYRQWGLQAVQRFRGMFAFALWDEASGSLHLCRDRFGVKPLYYTERNGVFAFASELKALHAAELTDRVPDPQSLAEFVQYGYVSAHNSIFADVRTVRPGVICTVDRSLRMTEHQYWSASSLFDGPQANELRSELDVLPDAELVARIGGSLQEAFEYRMVSDVPVGLFLSGGIDSSLVAALLARRSGFKLNTFTIGYGSPEFDERRYAREVADRLGATHVELSVSPQMALQLTEELPAIADEPIGDSSLLPTLMVSKLARQNVKVALSADGADELFGGYARYQHCASFVQRRSRLLRSLYWLSADLLDQLPPGLISVGYRLTRAGGPRFAAINDKLRKFVRMAGSNDDFEAYDAAVSEWSEPEARRLLGGPDWRSHARQSFEAIRGAATIDRFMHFDLTRYLPGDLLTKVDRASMHVSLEAREPFLDHDAARLAAALPPRWKIRNGKNKFVLRALLAEYFPEHLFSRPKQGFSAPVGEWLRGPLRSAFEQELSATRVRELGLLDPQTTSQAASSFLNGHRSGGSSAGAWILFQLQQWGGRWLRSPAGTETLRRAVGA